MFMMVMMIVIMMMVRVIFVFERIFVFVLLDLGSTTQQPQYEAKCSIYARVN